jgi:outer membrane protein OmpA-like peptidoglycan-associated protein
MPSAVEVTAGGQTLRLEQPYATAELSNGRLAPSTSTPETVRDGYGALLAQQPARPRSFTVQFEANGNRLADGAEAVLAEMRTALAALPASEVVIIGHTDRVGAVEANDRLSLARAEAVRDILTAAGVPRDVMVVAGRGEREPVVPTADEVDEARNRRVEIKVR